MNYHFISDDSFFLQGLRKLHSGTGVRAFFYKVKGMCRKYPSHPGDVVVIAVSNARLRNIVIKRKEFTHCRLMIMQDVPVVPQKLTGFPWLLPKNISVEAFFSIIQRAIRTYSFHDEVSHQTLAVFEQLCNEDSPESIAEHSRICQKTIYRIKRNVFREYGLLNCNSAGVLLCRDILEMKKPI